MGKIRYINNNDYDFIYQSILEYKPSPIYGIHNYVMPVLLENKVTNTLVYEDTVGKIKAYCIFILKPKSFFEKIYSSMPFYKKAAYLIKNQVATYMTEYENINDDKIKYITENLYSQDCSWCFEAFIYSQTKEIKAQELKLLLYDNICNNYEYSVSMIKKNNIAGIKSPQSYWGEHIKFYNLDNNSYLSVIDINSARKMMDSYNTNHIVELTCDRGGAYERYVISISDIFIFYSNISPVGSESQLAA